MNKKGKSKKKYRPPQVKTEKVFEKNALACGKDEPITADCIAKLTVS